MVLLRRGGYFERALRVPYPYHFACKSLKQKGYAPPRTPLNKALKDDRNPVNKTINNDRNPLPKKGVQTNSSPKTGFQTKDSPYNFLLKRPLLKKQPLLKLCKMAAARGSCVPGWHGASHARLESCLAGALQMQDLR